MFPQRCPHHLATPSRLPVTAVSHLAHSSGTGHARLGKRCVHVTGTWAERTSEPPGRGSCPAAGSRDSPLSYDRPGGGGRTMFGTQGRAGVGSKAELRLGGDLGGTWAGP